MNSRTRLLLASVAFVLLTGALLGGPAIAAAGPSKGTGGWYWPTGTEKLGSWDGYWAHRAYNHSWHMAKDIVTPVGHQVYAIADGVIAESKGDAGYGGVLVIWHKTGAGQKFLTVYGHIIRGKGMKKGAKVKAGQVVGKINSANHLHFGIHPGNKYPPDNNPFRGHTYVESNNYGWVDPIKFLKTHLAYQQPYIAPALPLVATVSTVSSPTVLGVAEGCVYWSVVSDEESPTVFARLLPSGDTTQLAEDATLPELDTTRYLAATSPTSFTLYDRLPAIKADYSTLTPAWKHRIVVTGTLKNAAGKPFAGAKLCLEQSCNGKPWVTVATGISTTNGDYSLGFAPTRSYRLRVKFTPPDTTYLAGASTIITCAPQPGLHSPNSAKQSKTGYRLTLSGKLDTRHAAGTGNVVMTVQRLDATGWTEVVTTATTNANSGKGTRYSQKLTLTPGKWRMAASCKADALHAAQKTGWTGFKIK